MRSQRWGLIAAMALVLAAVLLGFSLLQERERGGSASTTPTITSEAVLIPSPSPTVSPEPVQPVTYTVQAGDTLSAIAQEHDVSLEALIDENNLPDPDVLQVGQILLIPDDEDATEPIPVPTETNSVSSSGGDNTITLPTMTPSGPPVVEISNITGIGSLASETVTLVNRGGTVNLEAWTLSGSSDDRFVLPALTLFSEGEVRVHSAEGDDTPRELHWDRTDPAWREGELVTLCDPDGNVVDTYIIPE